MSPLPFFNIVTRALLDPAGPLSSEMSPSAITGTSSVVNDVQQAMTKKRGLYVKYGENMKIKIGKHLSENGVNAAARHFSLELGRNINPSTIHGFKKAYLQELNQKRRAKEGYLTVTSLPGKKRGHPLLLEKECERKVGLYLRAIRDSGGAVNTAIALGAAKGIVLKLNRTMLVNNGRHVDLGQRLAGTNGVCEEKGNNKVKQKFYRSRTLKSWRHK